ncbi:MAG: hypothetical protein PSV18_03155 [Methylobacter sp.]|nr:hypothetical protein [Candidatus Methylobacter titanis]
MRLDFNVLWVEDQKDRVMAQCEQIDLLIRKEGFRLQVEFASSIEQANRFLSDNSIYGDHIDLVLMDYDLGAGGKGDDGLVEVRNKFPYKDIVFYSSQTDALLEMVSNKRVQGVFCSPRDDLPDTVVGLFEALVKKVLDIDHSRGIVMGATSDIDHYVNDCLTTSFDNSDETLQKGTLNVVARHVKEKTKSFQKELERVNAVKHVSELLQEFHNVYTSNDRLRLLKNMLKDDESHQDSVQAITNYLDNTVPKRNQLAHVRVKIEGFSRKLFDKNNKELTSEQMKSLRQELLKHQEHFEKLSEKLSLSAPQVE